MGTNYTGHDPQNWAPGVTDATYVEHNIRYSDDLWASLSWYKNETRREGGNGWGIIFPGGGWASKGAISQVEATGTRPHMVCAMTLDTFYGLDDNPIDWFAVRYGMHTYGAQAPTAANLTPTTLMQTYEPTIEGGASANGPVSYAARARTWLSNAQQAVQFVKRNAARFDVDADRGFLAGESAGGFVAMVAALQPTRSFMPEGMASLRWDATHSSRVRGVLNLNSPASGSPYVADASVMGYAYGIVDSDATAQLLDMKRLCLVPESDGTFTSDSLPTSFLKTYSPLELIQTARSYNRGFRISSWYFESDLGSGPPFPNPCHDPRSFDYLDEACDDAGLVHTGHRMSTAGFGGDAQIMFETYILEMKDDIDTMIGD